MTTAHSARGRESAGFEPLAPRPNWVEDHGPTLETTTPTFRLGDWLQAFLVSWGMFGQQALLLGATWLHLQSRVLTIPARGLAAALAVSVLGALLLRPARTAIHAPLLLFLCFWGAYALRIAIEASTHLAALALPSRFTLSFIASMAFGACFLPGLAVMLNRSWAAHRNARLLSIVFAAISSVAMVRLYGQRNANFEHRMTAGETVGDYVAVHPLVLGYMGAVLGAFALYYLICAPSPLFRRVVLSGALGATGVVLLVGSASRGPMVALGIVALVLIASLTRVLNLTRMVVLIAAAVALVFGLIVYAESTGSSLFNRLFGIASAVEADTGDSSRLDLYEAALARFYHSPLIGASTSVRTPEGGKTYPHNLIVESLMATGLLGTVPLMLLLLAALRAGWHILTRHRALAWVPLLYVLHLTGAMFSLSIYSNTGLWLSLAATISCADWLRSEPRALEAEE